MLWFSEVILEYKSRVVIHDTAFVFYKKTVRFKNVVYVRKRGAVVVVLVYLL